MTFLNHTSDHLKIHKIWQEQHKDLKFNWNGNFKIPYKLQVYLAFNMNLNRTTGAHKIKPFCHHR